MIVRNEQIAAMEEAANVAFEKKLSKQLAADTAEMREFVHRAIARGRRHGIASQSDLAEFCALLLRGEPAWLRRILTDPKLDGSAKVLRIRARASEAAGGGAA